MKYILMMSVMVMGCVVGGCGSTASQAKVTSLDASRRAEIKTIALVPIAAPAMRDDVVGVWDLDQQQGVINQFKSSSRSKRLREMLGAGQFDFAAALTAAVKEQLERAGYQVVEVPGGVRPAEAAEDFVKDYASLGVTADAYLDLFVWRMGYATGGPGSPSRRARPEVSVGAGGGSSGNFDAGVSMTVPLQGGQGGDVFRPYVATAVRLVSAQDGRTLYADIVEYGTGVRFPDRFIAADRQFTFMRFEDMQSSSDRAIEGLRAGATQIAARIREDLR